MPYLKWSYLSIYIIIIKQNKKSGGWRVEGCPHRMEKKE